MATTPRGVPIAITLNGDRVELVVDPWVTLLDLVREQIGLTGSKKGCDHGQCGACTMIVDGKRMNSCLLLAVAKDGSQITTIEGLTGPDGSLHRMQEAFVEHDAYQCGYCTPGQICSAVALTEHGDARSGAPELNSRAEIRELMSGNICRCGAYTNIVDAIQDVLGYEGEDGRAQEKVQEVTA
jgi:xanthine dehydrogenase YagT iron-sulfur-binding subunit